MVLKCELKQVKHDTVTKCKTWTRADVKVYPESIDDKLYMLRGLVKR